MNGVKETILTNLKAQWKVAVQKQYQKEPEKVRNTNIDKNTNEIASSFVVKMAMKKAGITKDDIKRILTEIRDEVCGEEINNGG